MEHHYDSKTYGDFYVYSVEEYDTGYERVSFGFAMKCSKCGKRWVDRRSWVS